MSDEVVPTTSQQTHVLDIIRTETALSRYPAHNLSTGNISIEIKKKDDKGAITLLWKVSYNSEYGQPGERAYKLDTLIVNRRIDEAQNGGQSVPKIIRLGSLREICTDLKLSESGTNKSDIKQALFQNASAFITVKGVRYEAKNNTEQVLDAGFTRYSVVFTGEKLPNGLKADAVYLILNDIYMEILNTAKRRPLDYDYLRSLAAAPQRFYELVSYQMLPAVRYHQRAKLAYSEFCLFSTMTRYFDFDHVKKQMWKIHRPHVQAGYITKVDYEAIVDEEGQPDWNMFYTPGETAKRQQLFFTFNIPFARREKPPRSTTESKVKATTQPHEQLPLVEGLPSINPAVLALIKKFYRQRFGHDKPPSAKEIEQATSLIAEGEAWANYLVEFAARSGKEQSSFPEHFGGVVSFATRVRDAFDAEQTKKDTTRLKKARQSHQEAHRSAYHAFLGELLGGRLESALPEAFAVFSAQEKSIYQFHKVRAAKSKMSAQVVADYYSDAERVRRLLQFIGDNPKSGVPNFWQWDEKINPESFQEPK